MKNIVFSLFLMFFTSYADDLTCENLKNNPNLAFKQTPASFANINKSIFECDKNILNLKPIQNLINASRAVRGESISCVGSNEYNENLNKLLFVITKASFAPYLYAKDLPTPENADILREAQRGYFRFWANQAFYNFNKFKEFWFAFNEAQTPLAKFYEEKGFKTMEAGYFATVVLGEFLNYAVGSYPNLLTLKPDISHTQKAFSENLSLEQAISLLYSKEFTVFELDNILKTALLNNKEVAIIDEILKRGAVLNLGDETALFFALKSLRNIEFLIKKGANVNHKNSFGKSALFYATELNDAELTELLIKNGANVNEAYIDSDTKTAILSLGGSLPFYLNMCALEHTKRTVFMHAAAYSSPEILKILVKNGADVDAADELGFNAFDYAKMSSNKQNYKLLSELGLNADEKGE